MPSDLAKPGKNLAKKGAVAQLVTSIVIMLSALMFFPEHFAAVSFGSLAALVPYSFFAYWVFRYAGATKNRIVAQSFNQGIKMKLVMTMLFFVIAYSQFQTHPLPLLGAYVITLFSQWLAMLRVSHLSK